MSDSTYHDSPTAVSIVAPDLSYTTTLLPPGVVACRPELDSFQIWKYLTKRARIMGLLPRALPLSPERGTAQHEFAACSTAATVRPMERVA